MSDVSAKSKIFKALSDENRIRILLALQKAKTPQPKEGQACDPDSSGVMALAAALHLTPPTVSHHIKELVAAGLITTAKEGRWVRCSVNEKTLKTVTEFLNQFREGK
jgi:ArsR family transcriptional regulator